MYHAAAAGELPKPVTYVNSWYSLTSACGQGQHACATVSAKAQSPEACQNKSACCQIEYTKTPWVRGRSACTGHMLGALKSQQGPGALVLNPITFTEKEFLTSLQDSAKHNSSTYVAIFFFLDCIKGMDRLLEVFLTALVV